MLKNCHIVELDIPHYSLAEQTKLPAIIDSQKLDLIHYPHFNFPILAKTPFVVTIHDLIKHFYKGRDTTTKSLPVYYLKHFAYHLVISQAAKKSKNVIVPSTFTKNQLISYLRISDKKIHITYYGVSYPYNYISNIKTQGLISLPSFKSLQTKYKLTQPYFVYTGSTYPSKNIPCLLQALKTINSQLQPSYQLQATSYKLLIACARNIFWDRLKAEIEKMNLEKFIILPGKVSDEDLIGLYQHASAFIMPSFIEGFGLPALEAMSSGCPIISSTGGSLPEIYDKHALYFDPHNPKELADLMLQVINFSKDQRQTLIKQAQKYSQQYTWEKTAKQTLAIYYQTLRQLHEQK